MQQKIYILGGGSLGLLFGSKFSRAGLMPCLLVKSNQIEKYSAGVEYATSATAVAKKYFIEVKDKTNEKSIEKLIIATKANDAATAAKSIKKYLHPDASVLLLQNGMGSQAQISKILSDFEITAAVTTYAASKIGQAKVIQNGEGDIKLGYWSGKNKQNAQKWLTLLNVGGLNASLVEPVRIPMWHKLAVNSVINTLTSQYGCLNGQLAKPDMQAKVDAMVSEIVELFDILGVPEPFGGLPAQIEKVIYATALNTSSMLQDFQNGKVSELEYISGSLLKAAAAVNHPMPHQRGIYHSLQAKFNVNAK